MFLVRNPLSLIISNFQFFPYNYSFNTYLVHYAHRFAKQYHYLNSIYKKDKENTLWIHYENLKKNTLDEMVRLCDFVEISANKEILQSAIEAGSSNTLKKFEETGEFVTSTKKNHIRSGKIDEWKERLTAKQIIKIEKILKGYNIALNEFILE